MKFFPPCEYQENIEKLYQQFKQKLQNTLPHAVIEHVGSSSIPGLVSKGDLDICVLVSQQVFISTIEKLYSIGFHEKKDTLQNNELRMLICEEYQDVALQIVVLGSPYEDFLVFRDLLRRDNILRQKYNNLKMDCIDKDENEYRAIKSKFIQEVLGQVKSIK